MLKQTIHKTHGKARLTTISTDHGELQTPMFMPVGTCGSVKGITPDQLEATGSQMILANTYHLMLRPTAEVVDKLGGIHKVMGWDKPILTDSGGYQVFSLAHMRKMSDEGAVFRSHIDGSKVELTPNRAVDIQHLLGSDVMMQFDECPPAQAEHKVVKQAVERSAKWAKICKARWEFYDCKSAQGHSQALFGIQQGGVYIDLRTESAKRLAELDLPGYAVGGLSVGEGHQAMCDVLDHTDDQLPKDKPRYLMGVGEPRDIIEAVRRGIDMFDCVIPTRNGRNAQAFTWKGKIRMRNAKHALDTMPIDPDCNCYACKNFSRGVIRHLFQAKEMLGPTLVTIHNLHFFADLTAQIRQAIQDETLDNLAPKWIDQIYNQG